MYLIIFSKMRSLFLDVWFLRLEQDIWAESIESKKVCKNFIYNFSLKQKQFK